MPDPRLCVPCQRLLSGTVQFVEEPLFIHHPDADSIEKSLELHCPICSLAYRQSFQHRPIVGRTRGYLRDDDDLSAKILRFYWDPSDRGGSENVFESSETIWFPDLIFVPWEHMLDYRLPPRLSSRTDSSTALNFLLRTYRECKDHHVGCRLQNPGEAFPPLRVIDVGESTSSFVSLRNTQGFTDAPYTCLSYCWGKTQPLLLTKQTEIMLYNGISIVTLSKTFQDAVYVTRILGIRYLWIDSLCIFQDNEADWAHEASRMRLIYSHAVCTLAATSAEDSAGGFFFDRNPDALQPLCVEFIDTPNSTVRRDDLDHPLPGVYWCDIKASWTRDVEQAPLAYRAWVCQERHLSSRTIHFTRSGLYWECHEYKASENYPNGIPKWADPFWCDDQTVLKRDLHRLRRQMITSSAGSTSPGNISPEKDIDAKSIRNIYFAWCKFRIAYTRCNLTRETDKLVAIQGIADHMSTVVNDQLIAGLWRNHMLEDLCWFRFEDTVHHELTKWRAPTWSWASTNGTIWVSLTYRDHRDCPGWRLLAGIDSIDVRPRPSGELEHASLRIRCRPVSAILRLQKDIGPDSDFNSSDTLTFTNSKVQMRTLLHTGNAKITFDIDGTRWGEPRSLVLVAIQECRHKSNFDGLGTKVPEDQSDESEGYHQRSDVEGLLVAPQCGNEDVFQRVGIFRVSDDDYITEILREHEAAEDAIITLI